MLHIDRLVLRGVDRAERGRVVAELRQTVARQLAEPGAAERLETIGRRESLRGVAARPAASVGRSAGEAIARTLTR